MNKKGFTLMELLFVIVIVSLISISSVIVFGNIDDETSIKDRISIYKDIQKSALLYIDLNDYWLSQFKANGEIMIELSELKNSNYISIDIKDPVTNKEIPNNYMVKIYTAYAPYDIEDQNTPYIDTCIVDKNKLLEYYCDEESPLYDESECKENSCVANSKGESGNCCMHSLK